MSTTMNNSRVIQISKAMSYILRHGCAKERIEISADGYVKVNDLLKNKNFKNITFQDIQHVVDTNDKKRFELKQQDNEYYIRASQGHTIKTVTENDSLFTKITDINQVPGVIHGTYRKHLVSIKEKGLNKMDRNHIHFATGDHGDVVSGMRGNCEIVIYIDLEKALNDGIEFLLSKNGVVLCAGIQTEHGNHYLPPKYFTHITDRAGNIIR
ncbi:hypothetical protein DFA_09720 [Cavenderia fasciculata]|uniref:2'-phosphotransferase n=1 Tax=Cavenderia fasciculata TaxID=261658 RepID=F4Q8E8_CACFS|nr:uncharacterized protein DFA_09720 [Cavenderia fasciculata]EGG16048.1 hypothetical protein DFA_09720 [Cavenderia fasciculata]|eukprot:XP_004352373.1 hypothetical protein DFA_09720 [Cavenderia fasciculata]